MMIIKYMLRHISGQKEIPLEPQKEFLDDIKKQLEGLPAQAGNDVSIVGVGTTGSARDL